MYLETAAGNIVTVTVTPEQVAYFISNAISVVQPDYETELSQTLAHLKVLMEPYRTTRPRFSQEESVIETELMGTRPTEYSLQQNYPNPFNPSTTIGYSLPVTSLVTLKVYNSLGQEVALLVQNEVVEEGEHQITFNASQLASGVYLYKIIADPVNGGLVNSEGTTYTEVKKMVILK